jgi:hypothetical protein
VRYETLVRLSRAIGAHRNTKELFRILMDELHGVVQFDFVGISLRDQDSDTFQNYSIDMTSRLELDLEEQLTPDETLTLCQECGKQSGCGNLASCPRRKPLESWVCPWEQ